MRDNVRGREQTGRSQRQQIGGTRADAGGLLDFFQLLVGAYDFGRVEVVFGDAGTQHVDAVERGFCGDLLLFAGEAEAGVGDLELEVLADAPAVPDGADGKADLGFALKGGVGDAGLDLGERLLGCLQEIFTFACPLGGDEWVAADNQPLAGIVVGGDLGEVVVVEERELECALLDELLDLRRLQGVNPGGALARAQKLEVRLDDHAAVGDDDHARKPEAFAELVESRGQRLVVVQRAGEDLDRERNSRIFCIDCDGRPECVEDAAPCLE